MKTVQLKLTIAQHKFFKDEIETGKVLGDCEFKGLTLEMKDYEGANAMLHRFMRKHTATTRDYVTWNSVVDRLNAAIAKAASA